MSQESFRLADPVQPEVPTSVRTPRRALSASSLNAYATCERKWYFRYVCNVVDDPGSSAASYGTAFHEALEAFHKVYMRPNPAEETAMRRDLAAQLDRVFADPDAKFSHAVERELQRRRAIRTAERYIDWLLAEARLHPFTVVGCEAHAPLAIDGYDFTGYIDRIDRDDTTGDVTIYDYKTGSIAESAKEYLTDVRAGTEFQLPFYYYARSQSGEKVVRLSLIPLKDSLTPVRPVAIEITPLVEKDLDKARTRMGKLAATLIEGSQDVYRVATDPDACTYCAYTLSCRNRPVPADEKFGR